MKHILLAEDNSADAALMRRVFRERAPDFEIRVVDSLAGARIALQEHPPDLLIVDVRLPDGKGIDLIPAARECGCPAIVLTGHGTEAIAVEALRGGALDYLVKSQERLEELPHAATRALREWENMIERERGRRLLGESEERFRTFAELAADWFWETDAAMNLTFISTGFRRIGNLAPESYLGKPLRELCSADHEEFDWAPAEQSWRQQREFELEVPFAVTGEKSRTLYLRGKPVFAGDRRLSGYRGIVRDITTERETLQEITYLAMHDPLTNVLNRRSLESELKSALLGVSRHAETHAFCFFDLDSFKQINDQSGHTVGDRILQQVVAAIAQNVRIGDNLGRMGGDEFGVLLKHCTLSKAMEITAAIVDAVARREFTAGSQPVQITASAGMVALKPDHDVTQVFREADKACYEAKRAGGNQVCAA